MCGIVGIFRRNSGEPTDAFAASLAAKALRRLQHRGFEGAGLVTSRGKGYPFLAEKKPGLVGAVLTSDVVRALGGHIALAQTRYSTAGQKRDPNPVRNLGPLYGDTKYGPVAIAHNGNLHGGEKLRSGMLRDGSLLTTGIDTEIMLQRIARSTQKTLEGAILEMLKKTPLAYSLLIMSEDKLFAIRDPLGVRPLKMGTLTGGYAFASEDTALTPLESADHAEVAPGEMVVVDATGVRRRRFARKAKPRPCIFEFLYFMRPDSDAGAVKQSRVIAGRLLASYEPVKSSLVVGVPDSGLLAAEGYAEAAKVKLVHAMVRDHTEGRAFMRPTPEDRELAAELKHAVIAADVRGHIVTLIDDSLVRGTTLTWLIRLLRKAGAREVHARIASPKIIHPCYYGIDTPRHGELIAHRFKTDEAIAKEVGADSIRFLSERDLIAATRQVTGNQSYCTTCFDGKELPAISA